MTWQAVIGLEVHVQLATRTKLFCGCRTTESTAPPNTSVCPVCLGYPGALPVLNREAVRLTVRTGLMLGCRIRERSWFDRKSYFYPDMPKNYQISQYEAPLCEGGGVEIESDEGRVRWIRLRRIHLEEDVAKSVHVGRRSGIDFNRAGVPLMEIVTEPDLTSPEEAFAFLVALKQILLCLKVSPCNLEEGNLRCDINCSLRPAGQSGLGTKVEIKNLNTFKGVREALRFELERQRVALEAGERLVQETRRWDAEAGVTFSMRTKEQAHDYRYFPEPDLMPLRLSAEELEQWRAALPEHPAQRRERFMRVYGLPAYDARVLTAEGAVADYFEEAVRGASNPKWVANWMMTEMLRRMSDAPPDAWMRLPLRPAALCALAEMAGQGRINSTTAKAVLEILFEKGGDPERIVRERGWEQISDAAEVDTLAERVIREHERVANDYRHGKAAALQFLIGQGMRLSRGQINPALLREALIQRLGPRPGSAE